MQVTKVKLEALQKKYGTDEAIGTVLDVTRQAVQQMRIKYGIPSRMVDNPKRNEQIARMYKSGVTGSFIAREFGLSLSQTYRIIAAFRL